MENYNKNLFNRFLVGIAAVNVKTHDEYDQFMSILEKETNLKWQLGQKPTQLDIFTSHREKTCIHRVVGRHIIRYSDISYYDSKDYEIIEFSDLMKKENNMKFKVGDKVRVRSWNSMAKEFGVDNDGNIMLSSLDFWKEMKPLCGTVHTIDEVNDYGYHFKTNYYCLTDDMLEPVKEETKGEHFRKEIKQIRQQCKEMGVYNIVAVNKNGKPERCMGFCSTCLLHRSIPCQNGFKKWCAEPYEAQEDKPILDKVEHDYLAAVIAPKRIYKYVDYIVKRQVNEFYVIDVHIKHTTYSTKIMLPYFKKSESMYEGMKVERQYTLKELGLEKE